MASKGLKMTFQKLFKMPATGEGWRHYKSGLYTIVGMARDDKGDAVVVYTPYGWTVNRLPLLFTQSLSRFIQELDHDVPRFKFEREAGEDKSCPFIREDLKCHSL